MAKFGTFLAVANPNMVTDFTKPLNRRLRKLLSDYDYFWNDKEKALIDKSGYRHPKKQIFRHGIFDAAERLRPLMDEEFKQRHARILRQGNEPLDYNDQKAVHKYFEKQNPKSKNPVKYWILDKAGNVYLTITKGGREKAEKIADDLNAKGKGKFSVMGFGLDDNAKSPYASNPDKLNIYIAMAVSAATFKDFENKYFKYSGSQNHTNMPLWKYNAKYKGRKGLQTFYREYHHTSTP